MDKVTRRSFVSGVVALLPASALLRTSGGSAHAAAAAAPSAVVPPQTGAGYIFFDAAEARFVEVACERLIPADDSGPGALAAGVAHYLDRSLGGSWGAGERLHREGPWQPGSPLGSPLSLSPAALFRRVVRAINEHFATRGMTFGDLPAQVQDEFLASLESGKANLAVPSAPFFSMLLTMTVEGFFSNPFCGTRDRLAWRVIGFPGAFAVVS